MRKIILLIQLIILSLNIFGQYSLVEPKPTFHKEENQSKSVKKYFRNLNSRAFTESYFLNYGFANQPEATDKNSGPSIVTFMKLNRNYSNSDRGTLSDLLQYVGRNGELYHIYAFNNTTSKYVYNTIDITKTTLKIDSLSVPFAYTRKNNTVDSIIISLYDLSNITIPNSTTNNGTPISLTYTGAPLYRNAIPVTAAIAYTDTFNFSGGTTFPYTDYLIKPNLTLPAGKAFAMRVEFVGDTANYFQPIFDTYDECTNCVATQAYIENTTGYLNYIFPSTPPFNFSGALNRQLMFACNEPQNCAYYFPQTLRTSYYVTSTTQFNVKIDPVSNIRGCQSLGSTLDLAASYSGLDTVHKVTFKWRATGGKFDNGFDTITSTSPTYTFDTVGGFKSIILTGTATNGEVASDTIGIENWSMNPVLTATGKISCSTQDSLKLAIINSAAVGINTQLVTAYDALTTRNLSTNLNDLNGYFGIKYSWGGTGGYPRTDTTFIYSKTAGTFTLTVTNFVGCQKVLSYNAINTATSIPTLDFTFTPSTNICQNKDVNFKVTAAATRTGWTYSWKDGATAFTNSPGTDIIQVFTTAGSKTIYLNADSGACKATQVSKTLTVIASTVSPCKSSISESISDNIKVYPNPVRNGEVFIQNELNSLLSIRVTDMLGKVITTDKIAGNKTNPIDLSNAPNGVYFIELEGKNDRTIKKIIVDKQ